MQETRVRSLGQEDCLEKGMETHSSILVGKIPWIEEPGMLQSMGLQRSQIQLRNWTHTQAYMKCCFSTLGLWTWNYLSWWLIELQSSLSRNDKAGRECPFRWVLLWGLVAPEVSQAAIWFPHPYQDFPVAQMVKNLPTMQETWVSSLGQEDPVLPTRGAAGLALGALHHQKTLPERVAVTTALWSQILLRKVRPV